MGICVGCLEVGLLGNRIDCDRIPRAHVVHRHGQPARPHLELGRQRPPVRIPGLEPAEGEGGEFHPAAIHAREAHGGAVPRNLRGQSAADREGQPQCLPTVRARRPLVQRPPLLQSPAVVDEPFHEVGVAPAFEPLPVCLECRRRCHPDLVPRVAVARKFQPPLPAAAVGLHGEPAPVEPGHPLLAGVARLAGAVFVGDHRMPVPLVGAPDALPVGIAQAVGGLRGCGQGAGQGSGRSEGGKGKKEEDGCSHGCTFGCPGHPGGNPGNGLSPPA